MEYKDFPPGAQGGTGEIVRRITTKTAGSVADAIAVKEPERRIEVHDGNDTAGRVPEPAQPESCLAAALAYAARGWHVLPVHWIVDERCSCGDADCKSPGKHPLTKRRLLDATTDEATIRNWWNKWSFANVAIRTGEVSQILVVDMDGENGQETWRSIKGDKPLSKKEVLVATTGREGGLTSSSSGLRGTSI
jgi:hypothetical protein